jgi:hypothetical protein
MDWPTFTNRLLRRAPWGLVLLVGGLILAGLYDLSQWISRSDSAERAFQKKLTPILEKTLAGRERMVVLDTLKRTDVEQLKAGLGGHAMSEKSLFESGLSLQEERRLLEKQLDIMTTYLMVDPSLLRVFLMRDVQPLQSYLIAYLPLRAFGAAPAFLPHVVRIVSKERFAHPERGRSEDVNGSLQWVPPQVGTSVRSNALGEFVMFTNSALILHGPPLRPEDHERFPHICLGLDQEAARRLYRGSYIGTKIVLRHVSIEKAQITAPLPAHAPTQSP